MVDLQIYGEVSLSFVVRWKDVLDRLRRFINEDGNFHTVVYNQDLDKLVIVAGWTTLRDFYHLTKDHQVSLTHYGKSVFFLTIFKNSSLRQQPAKIISKMTLIILSSAKFCNFQGVSHFVQSYLQQPGKQLFNLVANNFLSSKF